MNKKYKKIFDKRLKWSRVEDVIFKPSNKKIDSLFLRMNDFPEEPLFTIFYDNQTFDIDDLPKKWSIDYDS